MKRKRLSPKVKRQTAKPNVPGYIVPADVTEDLMRMFKENEKNVIKGMSIKSEWLDETET